MDEIDEIYRQLQRYAEERPSASEPGESEEPPAGGMSGPEGSSPYLRERLSIASRQVAELGAGLRDLGDRWQRLEGSAEVLERELGHAAREIDFIRLANEASGPTTPVPSSVARPTPVSRPAPPPPAPVAGAAPYTGFTISRYNSTIGGLKARRRSLLYWTVALAAGISLALVIVQVFAREPMPVVWIAVLPVVWMIPVPFFLLSFLGTQRVLRRNHLDLAEDT
jgi:hypothetical protein